MAVWKFLMRWLVQGHSKNVPKVDLTKRRRRCSRYHSETKNASKNKPRFQGPKDMDMLQFHASDDVLVTFFSAHCKYSDFRQILTFQCFKNIWIFPHSFWRTDVFLQMRTTSRFDLLLRWLWCFCVAFATSRAKLLGVWYEVCEFKTNFNKFLSSTLCDARNNRKRRLRRKLKHLAPAFWLVPLVSWFLCGIKDAFICQV